MLRHKFGDAGVVGRDHPALAGRHLLVRIERKHSSIPERADALPFEGSSDCFARVLEHQEVVFAGDAHQFIHLAGQSEDVHGQYGLNDSPSLLIYRRPTRRMCASLLKKFPHGLGIQIESVRVDVDKDRKGSFVEQAVG
jgi:hypothetical protein